MLLQTFRFNDIISFHFFLMINTVVYYTLQIGDSVISVLYADTQKVSENDQEIPQLHTAD